jgi:hypothetical protein
MYYYCFSYLLVFSDLEHEQVDQAEICNLLVLSDLDIELVIDQAEICNLLVLSDLEHKLVIDQADICDLLVLSDLQ